jgi:hypothetical protein
MGVEHGTMKEGRRRDTLPNPVQVRQTIPLAIQFRALHLKILRSITFANAANFIY